MQTTLRFIFTLSLVKIWMFIVLTLYILTEIKTWMSQKMLCLNSDKSEASLIGVSLQRHKAGSLMLNVGHLHLK